MIIILSIYIIIGIILYLIEEKQIKEEEGEELELYDELSDNGKIMFFFFTILFWCPIILSHWFRNSSEKDSE
jgi:hypothetical protein